MNTAGGSRTRMGRGRRRPTTVRLVLVVATMLGAITTVGEVRPVAAVDGPKASTDDHPWAVRVHRPNGRPLCSGVAIDPQWVLTNAHCLLHDINSPAADDAGVKDPDEVSVVFGRSDPSTNAGFERRAEQIIMHPDYFLHRNAWSDIGLIKLSSPVSSSYTLPLGTSNSLSQGDKIQVFGYGVDDDTIATGDTAAIDAATFLRTATLTIGRTNGRELFYRAEGSISVQRGDSGAPLVKGGRVVGVNHGSFASGSYEGYGVPISPHLGWVGLMMEIGERTANRSFSIAPSNTRNTCLELQSGFGNLRRLTSPATCNSGVRAQRYQFTVRANGMLVVSNERITPCLGMEGGGSARSGNRVWSWDCNGKAAQSWIAWRVDKSSDGRGFLVQLRNRARPDLGWAIGEHGGATRLIVRDVTGRWGTSREVFRLTPVG